ncbi:MAG: DUF3520 domain-containing protein [bacterium]|nr:DUF3520 domain-containing protein [bacterium]
MKHSRLALLTFSAMIAISVALAQSGGIVVQVVDSNGPLPGAVVTISHEHGFVKTTAIMTDADGIAEFPVLRPGIGYIISVQFPGFGTRRVPDIRVQTSQSTPITVQLAAEIQEKVRVVAEGDVVDIEATQATARFSAEFIQNMPVPGRFYQNVLTLAPGVQDADGDGNPNVHSSRARDFQVVVSGISNVDPLTGALVNRVNPHFNTEAYDALDESPFQRVIEQPLSTFSIDVDTASYSNVRRFLRGGQLPPTGAVRIEEMVNYFRYDYPEPTGPEPFAIQVEVSEAPWDRRHRLAQVGIKGRDISPAQRPAGNFVFLLDVSGSMRSPAKLPLVKQSMRMLTETLTGSDHVSIVVYAGAAGLVLAPTSGDDSSTILHAIARLEAGGTTAGGAGIQLAYATARQAFIEGGINRVILCTDGDFNVGVSDRGGLRKLIKKQAESGVFLSVLGFGMGNYKDSTLEELADRGNGNYAYIDELREARKVLVDEAGSTLVTIAKDVKIQVEFNPAEVAAYRLIGYENRLLRDHDFNDDKVDAGEVGAGHTVTALYELVPAGVAFDRPQIDPLRYQIPARLTDEAGRGELMTVKVRYKRPDEKTSRPLSLSVVDRGTSLAAASPDFKFAAAVAALGMQLRDSELLGDLSSDAIEELAREGMQIDPSGYRRGFGELIEQARTLRERRVAARP